MVSMLIWGKGVGYTGGQGIEGGYYLELLLFQKIAPKLGRKVPAGYS